MARKLKQNVKSVTKSNLRNKLERAFSSANTTVYKRDKEVNRIKAFLASDEKILHIVGVPGSGKTSFVMSLCQNRPQFAYFNFYHSIDIKKEVLKKKHLLVVIDEFDKFYQFKPQDCKFLIHHIASCGGKIITLGNNLEFEGSTLTFKPYTPTELEQIIKLKIENEIGSRIITDLDLKLLCRANNNGGDMRSIFKSIIDNFDAATGTVTLKKDNCNEQEPSTNDDGETSIHHRLIKSIGKQSGNKFQAFKAYCKECEEYGVSPLSRLLFYDLFDVFWYK